MNLFLQKIDERIAHDKDEGDNPYFNALVLKLEYLTKIVTAGVVASVGDDADRNRYSLEYKLVRADSIGNWVHVLNSALVGVAAEVLMHDFREILRDLTERVGSNDWRYIAVHELKKAAIEVGVNDVTLGPKVSLRNLFEVGVQLRNRSRGHGAPTTSQCTNACQHLENSLNAVAENIKLFKLPWVYLHKNLSGKYRVSTLVNSNSVFDYLKSTKDVKLPDGVYYNLFNDKIATSPNHVPLIFTDPDILDLALPNGNYKGKSFEVLSYITNSTAQKEESNWTVPPAGLPESETTGGKTLEPSGHTFTNIPTILSGYVHRSDLEEYLIKELKKVDQHPIVTLTGPGGIGKTTTAIVCVQLISQNAPSLYDTILWVSARDLDLLDTGPKPVSNNVISKRDISCAVVDLLEPSDSESEGFDPVEYFQNTLSDGNKFKILLVLDNFETLNNPTDIYNWIDTYIRIPNKVLITTRYRDFKGDYPIEISGMSNEEASDLITQHAARLGISDVISQSYKSEIISESDGHPYIIKMLLGEVDKSKRTIRPRRIIEKSDRLLDALFERTYAALSPASQRVFLLLCSWRVVVPELAVQAVSMRQGTERYNVQEALDELFRYSLIERVESTQDYSIFVSVPLAATIYGRREFEFSPYKVSIEKDRKLLMEFGVGNKEYAQKGVFPRIENFFKSVAGRASASPTELDEAQPVLEFVARQYPNAYRLLVDLVLEVCRDNASLERAKNYMRQYIQYVNMQEKFDAWSKLASLCELSQDVKGEVHALCEAALLQYSNQDNLGVLANKINYRIRDLKDQKFEEAWSLDIRELLQKVIEVMEKMLPDLTATNCSRLAWLHLNTGDKNRANELAHIGVSREPDNEFCLSLVSKLD